MKLLKYQNKKQRLQAAIAAYQSLHPGPFTTEDIAAWAGEHELYPVPGRGTDEGKCLAWEIRLRMALMNEEAGT